MYSPFQDADLPRTLTEKLKARKCHERAYELDVDQNLIDAFNLHVDEVYLWKKEKQTRGKRELEARIHNQSDSLNSQSIPMCLTRRGFSFAIASGFCPCLLNKMTEFSA